MKFLNILLLLLLLNPCWVFSQQQELLLEVEAETPLIPAFKKLQRQLKGNDIIKLEKAIINHNSKEVLSTLHPKINKKEVAGILKKLKKEVGGKPLKMLSHEEKKIEHLHLRMYHHQLEFNVVPFDSSLTGVIEYSYSIVDSALQINSWRIDFKVTNGLETERQINKIIPTVFDTHLTLFQSFLDEENIETLIQLEKQLYENAKMLKDYNYYFAKQLDVLKIDLAWRFGFVANSFLYHKKNLANAEKATRRIEAITPDIEPFTTLLVIVNLLTDKFDRAVKFATLYKEAWPSKHKVEVNQLNIHLNRLEKKGIQHPDIEKLRQIINQ